MITRHTNRLAELQAQDWQSDEPDELLQQISENGTTNIHVLGDEHSVSWSYSTGKYDTWGQPEIVMTGFPNHLASSILQSASGNLQIASATPSPGIASPPSLPAFSSSAKESRSGRRQPTIARSARSARS